MYVQSRSRDATLSTRIPNFALLVLGLDPCLIRVSSVANRILLSRLASFFACEIGGVCLILLSPIDLRLLTFGFDFRIFPPEFAHDELTCLSGFHQGAVGKHLQIDRLLHPPRQHLDLQRRH